MIFAGRASVVRQFRCGECLAAKCGIEEPVESSTAQGNVIVADLPKAGEALVRTADPPIKETA